MNKKHIYILILLLYLITTPLAEVFSESATSVINAPTAFVNGFGGIDINFEAYLYDVGQGTGAYNNGGIMASFSYGFTDVLDLGISFDLGDINKDGLLAGPVDFRQPRLFAKLQLLTGTISIATGFDSRGYRAYDPVTHAYEVSGKGLYIVGSKKNEVQSNNSIVNITMGLNIPDFEDLKINGFFAAIISLNEKLLLYADYSGEVSNMVSLDGNFSIAFHIPVAPESFGIDVGIKNIRSVDLSEFFVRFHLVRVL